MSNCHGNLLKFAKSLAAYDYDGVSKLLNMQFKFIFHFTFTV